MTWITWTILGHLLNAVAFVIDKALLTTTFKRSGSYAAAIGMLSLLATFAIPWVEVWPSPAVWGIVSAFGVLFVLALWAFFEALRLGEASRVVPIVGSFIPLGTLAFSATFLGERLSTSVLVGVGCLLVATVLLAGGGSRKRLTTSAMGFAFLAAVLFALSSVAGKYAFSHEEFLGVFVGSRWAAGITSLLILLFAPGVRAELGHPSSSQSGMRNGALLLVGQVLGGIGFVLVQVGLNAGSATVVNALQAVQYAAIVLVAWFGGVRLRKLLQEEFCWPIMLRKGIAIGFVGVGLALVAGTVTL